MIITKPMTITDHKKIHKMKQANCDICNKQFKSVQGMVNHRRWHDLPEYKKYQEQEKVRLKTINTGERSHKWVGDKVGYCGVHDWVKRNKVKPDHCERCGAINPPKLDLANISGKYLRDVNDYEWLCRRCHLISDGRIIHNLNYRTKTQ